MVLVRWVIVRAKNSVGSRRERCYGDFPSPEKRASFWEVPGGADGFEHGEVDHGRPRRKYRGTRAVLECVGGDAVIIANVPDRSSINKQDQSYHL